MTPFQPTFDSWLDSEAQGDFWAAQAHGIHLWPGIRGVVLSALVSRTQGYLADHKRRPYAFLQPRLWAHNLRTLAYLYNPIRRPQHPALFFSSGFEFLYGYYYRHIPGALVVEAATQRAGKLAGHDPARAATVILENGWLAWSDLRSRLLPPDAMALRQIDDLVAAVTRAYDYPTLAPTLRRALVKYLGYHRTLTPLLVKRILPRLSGRLAFVNTAAYLGRMAVLTRALHEHGFTVVEAQHGIIYLAHPAYNYPLVCHRPDHPAQTYLPDKFLTFGPFWNDNIRLPAEPVMIGYPRLMEMVERLQRSIQPDSKQILIASGSNITNKMVDIALHLARVFPDHRIIFKLHPGEISFAAERCQPLQGVANIEIVGIANIHELIARSAMVIGEATTVLFETLAFAAKRIFILHNDFMPEGVGDSFSTPEELAALIRDPQAGHPRRPPSDFWADDPPGRIQRFLGEYGLGHSA
jgi:hypothetical protein